MLATIARFCVRHRRRVMAAWMLLFIIGIAIGSMVFGRLKDSNGGAGTESVQGYNIIQKATSIGPIAAVLVKGPPVAAPGTRAGAVSIERGLSDNVTAIDVIPAGTVQRDAAHLAQKLRADRRAFRTWVTGSAAFLLSRIKEAYDECGDTDHAVATGLQRSRRIITSAAFLVIVVFLGFTAGQTMGVKEFGLVLAIAVAATLVRCVLVPATVTLLGRANLWQASAGRTPPTQPPRWAVGAVPGAPGQLITCGTCAHTEEPMTSAGMNAAESAHHGSLPPRRVTGSPGGVTSRRLRGARAGAGAPARSPRRAWPARSGGPAAPPRPS